MESRNLDGEAGQVVLGMMFNKETTAMGRIHVCPANVAPCEDPECQMVVSIGREGSGNFLRGHRQRLARAGPLSDMAW